MLLPYFRSSLKSPWTYIKFENASIYLPISRCFLSHFHSDVYNGAPLSIFSLSFVFICVLLPLPDWREFLMVHPCLTQVPLLAAPTARLVPWLTRAARKWRKNTSRDSCTEELGSGGPSAFWWRTPTVGSNLEPHPVYYGQQSRKELATFGTRSQ